MSTKGISPGLANGLRSLAESQLQTQVSRSVALDAGALGVMSVDVAIAALILAAKPAHHLGIAVLALLGLSFAMAVRVQRIEGAKDAGPLVTDVLDQREACDDDNLERSLLEDLAAETLTNRQILARKALLWNRTLMLLVLAVILELVGTIH